MDTNIIKKIASDCILMGLKQCQHIIKKKKNPLSIERENTGKNTELFI